MLLKTHGVKMSVSRLPTMLMKIKGLDADGVGDCGTGQALWLASDEGRYWTSCPAQWKSGFLHFYGARGSRFYANKPTSGMAAQGAATRLGRNAGEGHFCCILLYTPDVGPFWAISG